jgi:hypothetical protein
MLLKKQTQSGRRKLRATVILSENPGVCEDKTAPTLPEDSVTGVLKIA